MSAIGADCTDRRRLDAGKSKAGIVVSDRWHVQKWADLGHLIASVASICRAIAYPTVYATAHWPDRTLAQCHCLAPLFRRRSRQESRVVVQGQTDQGIGRRGHFAGSFLAHALDEFFQPGACRQLPGHGLVSTGCSDSHRLLHRWQWNEWAIPPPLRPDLRSGKRWEIGRSTAAELGLLAARPGDGLATDCQRHHPVPPISAMRRRRSESAGPRPLLHLATSDRIGEDVLKLT